MNKKAMNGLEFSRKIAMAAAISAALLFSNCGGDGSPRIKDAEEKTVYLATKGTITEVEEIEPGDEYTIVDERIIDEKEDSKAIIHNLNGTTDTLSLAKMNNSSEDSRYQRSGVRRVLMYSLAASYFNRSLGNVAPSSSYYKDATAYNKSTGLRNELQKTATSRRIKVPGAASRGYGSGKSFRSFGG